MAMATVKQCEEALRAILRNHENTPPERRDNQVFLRRDILLHGWLLQNRFGSVDRQKLAQQIGESMKTAIDAMLVGVFDQDGYLQTINEDFFIISENMMQAIVNVFDDESLMYNITKPIAYFGNTKGFEFIKYFNLIDAPSNRSVVDMVINALTVALDNIGIADHGKGLFTVSKSDCWDFYAYITPNDGAFGSDDLNQVAANLFNYRKSRAADWNILLFAPDSEDSQVWAKANEFYRLYHIWPISVLYFFNRLAVLARTYGKQAVTEKFITLFPDQDQFPFVAQIALDKLEANLK